MDHHIKIKTKLLKEILHNVSFYGLSENSFRHACSGSGIDLSHAQLVCPRLALDLAVFFHILGDKKMLERIQGYDFLTQRFRDKVATAVRFRLESVEDKEAVRRAATLFALPQNAVIGAQLIWTTADAIWTGLGDSSMDVIWYTKRATLSMVYGSCVLFWLGDDSPDNTATLDFLDRRIENVMHFEKVKSNLRENVPLQKLISAPDWLFSKIKSL